MAEQSNTVLRIISEVKSFVIHLRLHYQLFILSGGFLMGGVLSSDLELSDYILQFINVHVLLFGGATAYNSYWDKDEGPIGGLRNPPEMSRWMWVASLILQFAGLLLAMWEGFLFSSIYVLSIILFWLYSTPLARWKNSPHKSLLAIGLSTGFNSVLMGYLAAGNLFLQIPVVMAAFGVMLILLSLYPVSQIYQRKEDEERGDQTFAVRYGRKGVIQFYRFTYVGGLVLVSGALWYSTSTAAFLFGLMGIIIGFLIDRQIFQLESKKNDYRRVMKIKYGASLGFVVFLLFLLFFKHLQ